jgi:hypothetical protein
MCDEFDPTGITAPLRQIQQPAQYRRGERNSHKALVSAELGRVSGLL